VTNGSQTVVGTINYDAFGQVVGTTGTSGSSYMYGAQSGYRNDWDAGLMHVGARYYDPQVGRFITPDSFLSENPFLYCEHDPVNFTDPTGHDGVGVSFGGVAQALLGVAGDVNLQFGLNGDVGLGFNAFLVSGPGFGTSWGGGGGYFRGDVSTGTQASWTAGGFAGVVGGISGSISGAFPRGPISVGGSAKLGPTVGAGAYGGFGMSGTVKLGNLSGFWRGMKGALSSLTFGLL
jgi:RHS repeat-associated protein